VVRHWIANSPDWIEVCESPLSEADDVSLKGIDAGERAAFQLSISLNADLLLMDDRKGVKAAEKKGLRVTGTPGVLDLAAESGLMDFGRAVDRLQQTSFRVPRILLEAHREKHRS